ncbi:MAG: uracil-DNA glycosylase [Planctomycetes bacterium]|nr:uracil-DNA glycosylase [Planctomycetota bacterium]MCA8934565.1 uracil-DNA glycosylase [Planctomycetota bacterium]
MAISRSELARQLRGHVELLASGGVRELGINTKAAMAAKPKKDSTPSARKTTPAKRPAAAPKSKPTQAGFKPVIVPSVALQELKAFDSKKSNELQPVAEAVRVCANCKLCETRTQTVFGTGDPRSPLMVLGEAPGGDEDVKGLPFVGRSGKLLTDIIEKGMKYKREHVYIANVVKCRPPHNRNPEPEEIEACRSYLERQIEIINPKVILAVGLFPAQWMTGKKIAIGKLRGEVHEVNGRKIICTYHPAYVLRNYTVETRKKVHADVMLAVDILGSGPLVS